MPAFTPASLSLKQERREHGAAARGGATLVGAASRPAGHAQLHHAARHSLPRLQASLGPRVSRLAGHESCVHARTAPCDVLVRRVQRAARRRGVRHGREEGALSTRSRVRFFFARVRPFAPTYVHAVRMHAPARARGIARTAWCTLSAARQDAALQAAPCCCSAARRPSPPPQPRPGCRRRLRRAAPGRVQRLSWRRGRLLGLQRAGRDGSASRRRRHRRIPGL